MKRFGIALIACGFAGFAHAADLPAAKPAEAQSTKPPCFSSLWNYLNPHSLDDAII
jgi:hypothetical protein